MNKHVFFRHYHQIAAVSLGIIIVLGVISLAKGSTEGWNATLALATIVGGFVYFIQKQRLDDVALFHELFTKFNARYDALNEALNGIVDGDDQAALTPIEKGKLHDYFNLCAEEFFFFKHDCIYPEAWEAWVTGMRWFYTKSGRISRMWDEELKSNSYYGFKRDDLLKGSEPSKPSDGERK